MFCFSHFSEIRILWSFYFFCFIFSLFFCFFLFFLSLELGQLNFKEFFSLLQFIITWFRRAWSWIWFSGLLLILVIISNCSFSLLAPNFLHFTNFLCLFFSFCLFLYFFVFQFLYQFTNTLDSWVILHSYVVFILPIRIRMRSIWHFTF